MNNLFTRTQAMALDLAMNYVLKDPAHNLTRLLDLVETLDIRKEHAGQKLRLGPE